MGEELGIDGRALRQELEVEQAAVAALRARAAVAVDVERLQQEHRAALAALDATAAALQARRVEAAAQVEAHAVEARRLGDAALLVEEVEPLDGLTPRILTFCVAVVAPLLVWAVAVSPLQGVPPAALKALLAAGLAVPLAVLPAQAFSGARRWAAAARRR